MRRTISSFAILLMLSVLFLSPPHPSALAQEIQAVVVGESVNTALAAAERVRVVVYLRNSLDRAANLDDLTQAVQVAQDEALSSLSEDEFTLQRRFETIPAFAGDISASGVQRLAALPSVLRIDIDEGGTGHLTAAAALTRVNIVRDLGYTGKGVTVAVLDSGVDTDHPDLADDLTAESCFCSGGGGCCPNSLTTQTGTGAAEDDNGHGTNVSGIVTSRGTVAPLGVAPDADLVAVKVLAADGSFCCSSDVVAGLDWIIANRPEVQVVNMSLGTSALFAGDCDDATAFTMAFRDAINTLRSRGTTTFASAGNEGSGTQMTAPACIANAFSTGAVYDGNVGSVSVLGCTDSTTAADKVTCFSNSNSVTDIFAPGAPITSTGLGGGTSTYYGTSQASPHAAGCVADLLQARPALTPDRIEQLLEQLGVMITNPKNALTFPRIDCLAALSLLDLFVGEEDDAGRESEGQEGEGKGSGGR